MLRKVLQHPLCKRFKAGVTNSVSQSFFLKVLLFFYFFWRWPDRSRAKILYGPRPVFQMTFEPNTDSAWVKRVLNPRVLRAWKSKKKKENYKVWIKHAANFTEPSVSFFLNSLFFWKKAPKKKKKKEKKTPLFLLDKGKSWNLDSNLVSPNGLLWSTQN